MEFIYDTEDGNFTVDIEDTHRSDNFITYIIPTKNPTKEFSKCLQIATEMKLLHPNIQTFLYDQLHQVPESLMHSSLYNLSIQHGEDIRTITNTPLQNSDDPVENKLRDDYLTMLDNELKHIKKYLKLSDQALRNKAYLGIIEINDGESLAKFYLDNIATAVLNLSFTLTRHDQPVTTNDNTTKGSSNTQEPSSASNVISLPVRRKTEEDQPS